MVHSETEIAREHTERARARRHGVGTRGTGEQRLEHTPVRDLDANQSARSRLVESLDRERLTDPAALAANAPARAQAAGPLDHHRWRKRSAGRRQHRYDPGAARLEAP